MVKFIISKIAIFFHNLSWNMVAKMALIFFITCFVFVMIYSIAAPTCPAQVYKLRDTYETYAILYYPDGAELARGVVTELHYPDGANSMVIYIDGKGYMTAFENAILISTPREVLNEVQR